MFRFLVETTRSSAITGIRTPASATATRKPTRIHWQHFVRTKSTSIPPHNASSAPEATVSSETKPSPQTGPSASFASLPTHVDPVMSPHQFKPLFARAWRIGPPVLLPRENSGLESQSQAQNVSINDAYHANELVRCLVKTFEFEKFATAWKFVEGLRDLTQLTRHHPMITIDSRKVHIYLHTHDARSGTSIGPGVTMRDVDFAALLEESLSTLSTTDVHPGITTAEDTAKLLARTKDMKAEAKAAKLRH